MNKRWFRDKWKLSTKAVVYDSVRGVAISMYVDKGLCHLNRVFVKKKYRGCGISSILFRDSKNFWSES